jgi:RHS repeat-associated protein
LEADFGFAGMFQIAEAGLTGTRFRNYDPELGRWLSRDPLRRAETKEGPNLYAYVRNNPVNATDPLGLCCEKEAYAITLANWRLANLVEELTEVHNNCETGMKSGEFTDDQCNALLEIAQDEIKRAQERVHAAVQRFRECILKGCDEPESCPNPGPKPCWTHPITGMTHCPAPK